MPSSTAKNSFGSYASVASPRQTRKKLDLSVEAVRNLLKVGDEGFEEQAFCGKVELVGRWGIKLAKEDPEAYSAERELVALTLSDAASALRRWCNRLVEEARATRYYTRKTERLSRCSIASTDTVTDGS